MSDANDFVKWFEGSKTVDAQGRPLPLYHGTADTFDRFRTQGTTYLGIYLSADANYAKEFGPKLKRTHARICNPFVLDLDDRASPHFATASNGEIVLDERIIGFYRRLTTDAIQALQQRGYDGIIANYRGVSCFEVVAFEPDQVRSAPLPSLEFKTHCRGVHGGQTDLTLVASATGDVVGWIDYSVYADEPSVQYIETTERRQGVATALARRLQAEFPGAEIAWGALSEAGSKFLEGLPREFRANPRFAAATAEFAALKTKLADLQRQTAARTGPMPESLSAEWNGVHDREWVLEEELRALSPGRWLVVPEVAPPPQLAPNAIECIETRLGRSPALVVGR